MIMTPRTWPVIRGMHSSPTLRWGNFAPRPTALNSRTWDEILRGTESLGWKITRLGDDAPFPDSESPSDQDQQHARNLFDRIKREIAQHRRPVVLWGIPIPEYGIVTGYRGENYHCSTYRRLTNLVDEPLRFDAIQAPGCLHAFMFSERNEIPAVERDTQAIFRAARMARGEIPRGVMWMALKHLMNGRMG